MKNEFIFVFSALKIIKPIKLNAIIPGKRNEKFDGDKIVLEIESGNSRNGG